MMRIRNGIGLGCKSLVFVSTYVVNQVVFNPAEFRSKLNARFGVFRSLDLCLTRLSAQSGFGRISCNCEGRKEKNRSLLRRIAENSDLDAIPSKSFEGNACDSQISRPRILYSITNSAPHTLSGYTVRTAALIRSLVEQGAYVVPVTRFGYPLVIGKFPHSNPEIVGGVAFFRNFSWLFPQAERSRINFHRRFLVNIARKESLDVLVATSDYRNAVPISLAAKDLGIPWVYEVRGHPELTWLTKDPLRTTRDEEFLAMQSHEIQAANAAARVMVLSESSKDYLVDLGVDESKITIVPNSFEQSPDLDISTIEEVKRKIGVEGQTVVGTVSSIVDYEGLETLICSLKHLPDSFACVIVGDGESRGKLELLARELQLDSRVKFVGRVPADEVWNWYAALDVFVLPRRDTLVTRVVTPVKAMQAMAIGIPVVASDLPAIREVTGGYATYFIPEDAKSLAEAITSVKNNGMGQRAKEEFESWRSKRTWNFAAQTFIRSVS